MTAEAFLVAAIPGFSLLAAMLAIVDRVSGGRFLGGRLLGRVAVWGVGLSAASATVAAVIAFTDPGPRFVILGTWLETGSLTVDIGFQLDPLSATMALTIAGLSWLVARFSVNYLHNEDGFGRYFTVLPLFVAAMLFLVLAENYLMLFIAWEVVGACSYLLIAFYRNRHAAGDAGTRAFVLNRVGDAGLLAGIFVLAAQNNGLSYVDVLTSPLPSATGTAVGLCLLVGAAGKSAQMPLGGWLARAMEGPTPSSALIHGATMVTAGVYLVVRSAPIYERAPLALVAVGLIGAITVLYGQLAGLTQTDIKGMLAASTNAHLGFMLLLCGLGLYTVAIFHLVAHAFYKTNLFLTAPSILHHLHGGPDPATVARPTDTARGPAVLVGAAALVLLAVPLVVGPLSLPEGWARGTVALGGLGAVAAFGLWFSATRMVSATFHDDARKTRRSLVAVVVGFGLVAVAVAVRLVPGGVEGSWFAQLLAPTVSQSGAPVEAPFASTVVLLAALICLMLSGIAVPRFFDRFRPEAPPGTGGRFARRLYFAAANRAWLDEAADRATAALTRAGAGVDRFERAVLDPITGTLLPSYGPRSQMTWEERLQATVRAGAGTDEVSARPGLEWLGPASRPGRAWAGRRLPSEGTATERLSSLTTRLERRLTSQAGGLYGAITNAGSSLSERTERVVFQRGVESTFERLSRMLASLTEAVENHVFQLGPGRVAEVGGSIRRGLLRMEVFLGRPIVAVLVALGCIVAVATIR